MGYAATGTIAVVVGEPDGKMVAGRTHDLEFLRTSHQKSSHEAIGTPHCLSLKHEEVFAVRHVTPAIATLLLTLTAGMAMADEPDAAKGEKVFKKCKACHVVDEAKNKVGPHLVNIYGRTAGSVEGYKYSKAMLAKGEEGLVWNEETLDAYLANPRKYIPKNKMTYRGIKKDSERADLIAYLKSVSKTE